MKKYWKRTLAAIIAATMVMSSTATVYADDDLSVQDDGVVSTSSENKTDDAARDDNKDVVAEESSQAESIVTDSTVPEGNEEVVPATATGMCGDNLTWTLVDGVLTISGTGKMYDWGVGIDDSLPTWLSYSKEITSINIEEGVTSIGTYMLYSPNGEYENITSIKLPNSLTNIGNNAFFEVHISTLDIPDGVISIGKSAFYCCSLQSVTIPDSVTTLGSYVFGLCYDLTDINYSGTKSQWNALMNKFNLKSEYKSKNVHCNDGDYDEDEFASMCGDNLTWSYEEGVLTISGTGEMYNYGPDNQSSPWYQYRDKITTINLPEGLTAIGVYAFIQCTNLEEINIPSGVTSIGGDAFSYCTNLKEINIPNGVTSIGSMAFRSCTNLTEIKLPESLTNIGEQAFNGCSNLTDIDIPDGVTSIGDGAFSYTGLAGILLPDGMTTIGSSMFSGCKNFTEICIPDGITSIEDGAFSNCSNMTKITIPDSVTSINRCAFAYCSNLTEITLPNNLTTICELTFKDCSNLKTISIPIGVISIEDMAFDGCDSLTDVYYGGSKSRWSVIDIDETFPYYCYDSEGNSRLTSATIHYTSSYVYNGVDYSAVYDYKYYHAYPDVAEAYPDDDDGTLANFVKWGMASGRQGNEEFNVYIYMKNYPELVSTYGSNLAGYYMHYINWGKNSGLVANKFLNPVTVKDGVDYSAVYDYEYYHANSDVAAAFPADDEGTLANFIQWGMTSGRQGNEEFNVYTYMENYPELKEVYGDNLAGYYMHYVYWGKDAGLIANKSLNGSCGDNLTWSYADGTLTISGTGNMDNYMWSDEVPWNEYCNNITNIILPEGLSSIGCFAFYDCQSLKEIEIPTSVTTIGFCAFEGCSSLTNIELPEGITGISLNAFAWCSGLTTVTLPSTVTGIDGDAFGFCDNLTSIYIPKATTGINSTAFENTPLTDVYYEGSEEMWAANNFDDAALKAATIHYNAVPALAAKIITQPTDAGADLNSKVSLSVAAKNVKGYQWQYSEDNGDTWKNIEDDTADSSYIEGAMADTVTILTTDSRYSYVYRCQITGNNEGVVYTDTVTIKQTFSGSCGDDLSWTYADGTLTITGSGAMYDFYKNVPWTDKCDSITSINLPEGLSYIGNFAFSDCVNLKNIDIPASVTSMGVCAFNGCNSLTSMTFPEGMTSIPAGALEGCSSLTSVSIPTGVTSINGDIMWGGALEGCSSLTSITLPSTVTSIEACAFEHCSGLTEFVIPDGVTSIGSCSFGFCSNLADITIPSSVTSIESGAFTACNKLTKLSIPGSVTSIEYAAFEECDNLTDIYFDGSEEMWSAINIDWGCNDPLKAATIHYNTDSDDKEDTKKTPAHIYNGEDYSAVYDFEYFQTKYPDVKEAFGDDDEKTLENFVKWGMTSGRQGNEEFNVNIYMNNYPELKETYGSNLASYYYHYIWWGKAAGWVANKRLNPVTEKDGIDYSAVYDYEYFHANQDIVDAFGDDDEATLNNFIRWGMTTGRQGNEEFNVKIYMANYPELKDVYGDNLAGYYMHYVYWGKDAGLVANKLLTQTAVTVQDGIDYSDVYDYNYFHANQDVANEFGDDDVATLANFVRWGMTTGRQGSAEFNVYTYMNNYPELKDVYGDNLAGYYMHYIWWGKAAGWVANEAIS